jgi:hypothetical protein
MAAAAVPPRAVERKVAETETKTTEASRKRGRDAPPATDEESDTHSRASNSDKEEEEDTDASLKRVARRSTALSMCSIDEAREESTPLVLIEKAKASLASRPLYWKTIDVENILITKKKSKTKDVFSIYLSHHGQPLMILTPLMRIDSAKVYPFGEWAGSDGANVEQSFIADRKGVSDGKYSWGQSYSAWHATNSAASIDPEALAFFVWLRTLHRKVMTFLYDDKECCIGFKRDIQMRLELAVSKGQIPRPEHDNYKELVIEQMIEETSSHVRERTIYLQGRAFAKLDRGQVPLRSPWRQVNEAQGNTHQFIDMPLRALGSGSDYPHPVRDKVLGNKAVVASILEFNVSSDNSKGRPLFSLRPVMNDWGTDTKGGPFVRQPTYHPMLYWGNATFNPAQDTVRQLSAEPIEGAAQVPEYDLTLYLDAPASA